MVMRFFNIFGPYQRPNHEYAAVIPKWIWKAMNNEVLEVYGDGEQSRDFTFVADVVEVIRKVIVEGITSTHPINLAFGVRITLNEVLDELKKYFPNLKVNYLKPRPGDVRDSQNSPKLLRSLFPDLNAKSFEVAFRDTVLWLDKNVSEITRSPQVVD
jgi:UDP-glucose 4-epimerase